MQWFKDGEPECTDLHTQTHHSRRDRWTCAGQFRAGLAPVGLDGSKETNKRESAKEREEERDWQADKEKGRR